jgi:hypothetical protein
MTEYPETLLQTKKYKCTQTISTEIQYIQNNNCTPKCQAGSYIHIKGKAVPLKAWSGPEGSRRLRFPYFKTTAQDGGKVVSLTHRPPLPPGNTPGTHFCYRLS